MRRGKKPRGPGGLSLCLKKAGQGVMAFLWFVYHSAAEGMPDKMKFCLRDMETQDRPSTNPPTNQ